MSVQFSFFVLSLLFFSYSSSSQIFLTFSLISSSFLIPLVQYISALLHNPYLIHSAVYVLRSPLPLTKSLIYLIYFLSYLPYILHCYVNPPVGLSRFYFRFSLSLTPLCSSRLFLVYIRPFNPLSPFFSNKTFHKFIPHTLTSFLNYSAPPYMPFSVLLIFPLSQYRKNLRIVFPYLSPIPTDLVPLSLGYSCPISIPFSPSRSLSHSLDFSLPPSHQRTGSRGGTVRVANITTAAEGPFYCEVSAEGPTFHTASDTANMKVVGE